MSSRLVGSSRSFLFRKPSSISEMKLTWRTKLDSETAQSTSPAISFIKNWFYFPFLRVILCLSLVAIDSTA